MKAINGLTWAGIAFVALLINSAYIGAFAFPTIFYMTNVLFHLGLGTALFLMFTVVMVRNRNRFRGTRLPASLLTVAFLLGAYLAVEGNTTPHRWALWFHLMAAVSGTLGLAPHVWRATARNTGAGLNFRRAYVLALAILALLPVTSGIYGRTRVDRLYRIRNPRVAPASMDEEGQGPRSPFFPSSARTNVGGIIPANFFMDSQACGECHKDIYTQWKSSMHHFASFNNQFYRKSIEYMQDVVGTRPSKWCAGCHDHAVFFNGRFDRPMREQIDTAEAHAGLACTSCHSIVHVNSSMGNGDFTIEYPPLHELATSKNFYMHALDHFLTYLNPAPHKKSFMKPFMRLDAAEFCSACHKVHLDVPVNQYRWFRGFNDCDNWQASGVSGQGARSFYYPANSSTCVDCHMPLVASRDPGNHQGQVHSHRFPAANMAVAYVNRDKEQLKATGDFLRSGFISVDIFAVAPVMEQAGETSMVRRLGEAPQIMSSVAVGEEGDQSARGVLRQVGHIAAPIDRSGVRVPPGSTVRVDVVVRTRKIGHFFPGGTVDAFDVWLELQGKDAAGNVIFWSGGLQEDGKGPVEPSAHFYRSYQLDGAGNPINKRNAWQARSVLYVHMIPPGAADVVHYRLKIPPHVVGPITLTAKLNYRKFSRYYTEFAYAGKPEPGQDTSRVGPDHNSLAYSFDKANIPANVSGQIRHEIPDIPVVTLAQGQTQLNVNAKGGKTEWNPVVLPADRERWNDWGIGLLLQGDLKGAEYAFTRVTEAEPGYADGWLNVARALIQEGETDRARPFLAKAVAVNSQLGRVYFFQAMVEKADGNYEAALNSLRKVASWYPRDRVVLDQIGRILFLKREYAQAIRQLQAVYDVDPEDLPMHYTLMLCYRGLGDRVNAEREEKLFLRFKAEEASQSITETRRLASPEDNNERQTIHDHESVVLPRQTLVSSKHLLRTAPTSPGGSQ